MLSTMRCAIIARILLSGTNSPVSFELAGPAAAALPAPCSLRWRSTSSFVMRPSEPVPATWPRSRLLSLAIRRTSGEERSRSPALTGPARTPEAGAAFAAGAETAAGAGAAWPALAVLAGPANGAAPPITATTVLTPTVAPSATLISLKVPATGEGISASTLSVEISNSGSSFTTVSPAFLSHLVMVPSKIDSPIWGITTSVCMDPSLRVSVLQWRARFQPDYKSQPIRQPNRNERAEAANYKLGAPSLRRSLAQGWETTNPFSRPEPAPRHFPSAVQPRLEPASACLQPETPQRAEQPPLGPAAPPDSPPPAPAGRKPPRTAVPPGAPRLQGQATSPAVQFHNPKRAPAPGWSPRDRESRKERSAQSPAGRSSR